MHSKLYLKLGEKKKVMLNQIFKVSVGNSDQAVRSKDPNALFIDEVRTIDAPLGFGQNEGKTKGNTLPLSIILEQVPLLFFIL